MVIITVTDISMHCIPQVPLTTIVGEFFFFFKSSEKVRHDELSNLSLRSVFWRSHSCSQTIWEVEWKQEGGWG